MLKQPQKRLSSRAWAPLFMITSLSWLVAPALHQQSGLQLISHYESFGQPYGWLFRLFDTVAACLLAYGAWRYVKSTDRRYYAVLAIIAVLALCDALFPSSRASSGWQAFSDLVHSIESVVSVGVIASLAIFDAARRRNIPSILIVMLQIICLSIAIVDLDSHNTLTLLQYVYQVAIIGWLAWLVRSHIDIPSFSELTQRRLRQVFGYATATLGIVFIFIDVLPIQHYHRILHGFEHDYSFISQHSVATGVIMLYLARHIAQGQRRAATLLGLLLSFQIVVYSIIRPVPVLLLISLLAYVALWYAYPAFGRNRQPLRVSGRLADAGVVIAGVGLALGLFFAIVQFSGRQAQIDHIFDRAQHATAVQHIRRDLPETDTFIDRQADHLQHVGSTLIVATILILLWSLFRPSGLPWRHIEASERRAVHDLLCRYSNSSEDFFKLWPEDKQYFFNKHGSGFIAYKVSGGIAFALADPIAALRSRRRLIQAFRRHCHEHGLSVCFLMVPDEQRNLYRSSFRLLKIGSSAVVDIEQFNTTTVRNKWWRWQSNRAQKAGYSYQRQDPPHSSGLLAETASLSRDWLRRNGHVEQSFALGFYDNSYLQRCTLHTLRDNNGNLIAFANQLPSFNHSRQATVDLIRFQPQAEGAMPSLIMHIILQLAEDGRWDRFDLGFVPLAKVNTPIARLARTLAASRFSAAGLEQFKNKFKPAWQANYIAYEGDVIELGAIMMQLENLLKVPK